ncbi:unnamed protein product [Dovyalis caffra]|uniref:C3H1-type domain-containing protein n=1 Tax=Dovyalis caffra TaxID=77055 RepID=A0AAV1SCH0_9ROSI|nr:unnamed protein product [Dovyalis caffra]
MEKSVNSGTEEFGNQTQRVEIWDDFVIISSLLVRVFSSDRDRGLTIAKDSGFLIHMRFCFDVLFISVLFLFYSMDFKTLTVRSHTRVGGRGGGSAKSNAVCYYWKEGKCNRNPCRFLHSDSLAPNVYHRTLKQSQDAKVQLKKTIGAIRSDKSSPSFGHEDLPRKFPSYTAKKSFVLKGVNNQESSYPRTEDPSKKCLDQKDVLVSSTRGSGSDYGITQNWYDSTTEAVGLKRPRVQKKCTEDSPDHKESSYPGTEDLRRKHPNPMAALVSSTGGGGSDDGITQNCYVSVTEAVGLKRVRVQKKYTEDSPKDTVVLTTEDSVSKVEIPQKDQLKACEQWMLGSCVEGKRCQFLHSWFHGVGFFMLAKLSGHIEAVSGIALPSGSDKLYSGSTDGTVRIWDCHTGQSVRVMNLGDDIGSLISVGSWVFVGMPNVVKAWNIQTAADFSLNEPVGQVYAMAAARNMLCAGAQNGVILVWKGSTEKANPFQLATSLEGHTGAVNCLAVGAKWLYSGSADSTIRVWDLDTLQCIRTLNGHADAVMSLVCWNQYLLSCSLDRTIKVWFASDGSSFEVTYTHDEDHGAVALCGVNDAETKPVLLCSCNDNSVHLYELPSFSERGRIFSKQVVRTIQVGPDGLFFTGDGTGLLSVWKWAEHREAS